MKKIKILFFFVLCMFAFNASIFAVCNDEELNDWAETIEILFQRDVNYSYLTVDEDGNEEVKDHIAEYYYKLLICEPRSDVSVKVTDSSSSKEYDAVASEFDNSYIVGSQIHFSKRDYTIKIYGNSSSACPGELLKALKYSVPAYNTLLETEFCQLNSEDEMCQADTDISKYTEDEIKEHMSDVEEDNKIDSMTVSQKIFYYIGKYWYYVVAPIVIVSIIYTIKIIKLKKKGDNE